MANPTTPTLDAEAPHRTARTLQELMANYGANDRILSEAARMSIGVVNYYRRGERRLTAQAMDKLAVGFDRISPPGEGEPPFDPSVLMKTPAKAVEWLLENRRSLFSSKLDAPLVRRGAAA